MTPAGLHNMNDSSRGGCCDQENTLRTPKAGQNMGSDDSRFFLAFAACDQKSASRLENDLETWIMASQLEQEMGRG